MFCCVFEVIDVVLRMSAHTPMLFSQSDENHENVDEHSDEHLDFIHTHASTLYIYHIIYIYIYIYTFMIYIYIIYIYMYYIYIYILIYA